MENVNAHKNRPFMTAGEIIKLAKVHPNTIAVWRTMGKIRPKDKVGSSFLYDRKEVEEFLQQRMLNKRNKKAVK